MTILVTLYQLESKDSFKFHFILCNRKKNYAKIENYYTVMVSFNKEKVRNNNILQ